MEEFKWIPGYEGLYDVSNWGRVRSYNYYGKGKLEFLVIESKRHGYFGVMLSKSGKRKSFCVHQLVAMAFLGHKPNGYTLVVDHIDKNKANNRLENLRLVTNRFNTSRQERDLPTGVMLCKRNRKFRARFGINRKRKWIDNPKTGNKYFDTVQEAEQAILRKKQEEGIA
jgi:hypothetical protein